MGLPAATWTVTDAKARLSEVIERARSDGPQTITRRGREAVVVVSVEDWEQRTRRRSNLAEFFAASPLRGSGLTIERPREAPAGVLADDADEQDSGLPSTWI